MPQKIPVEEIANRFTLIVGDVKSGKTMLTRQILEDWCRAVGGRVTVVDLAPEITQSDLKAKAETGGVGGKLDAPAHESLRYYHRRIHPPRLRARDETEAQALAGENLRTVEEMFAQALSAPSDALFINECSLHLHAGSPSRLLEWIRSSPTAVVNGYFGRFFGSSPLSIREKNGMEFLMRHCDRLIRLS